MNRLLIRRVTQQIRQFNGRSTKTLQVLNKSIDVSTIKSPWTEVQDPKGSHLSYWWNKQTNETTALGAIKPEYWIEQPDPAGSRLTYWWNPETNDTTALGASDPSKILPNSYSLLRDSRQTSFGGMIVHSMMLGFGVSFAVIMVRMMIG